MSLDRPIGKFSRKEILIVATLLHDIAKTITVLQNKKTLATRCPGHEMIGSFMSMEMGKRFGLDVRDNRHLQQIVHYHGFIHDILSLALEKKPSEPYIQMYRNITKNMSIEIALLAYADMLGSDLPKVNKAEFDNRKRLIIDFLRVL